MATIVRAQVAHTPSNPFTDGAVLQAFSDRAVAFADGRILARGAFADVHAGHPEAEALAARDTFQLRTGGL